MPTILHNATNQPHIDLTVGAPRSPLRRKLAPNASKHVHSPDGYFPPDEAARAWSPLAHPDPASLRIRSKTHIGYGHIETPSHLQEVKEEEDTSNPHAWQRPSRTDSRSPCPALNVLSNHAYLPRDGRNISLWDIVRALQEGYGASWVLAFALTFVSFVILRLGGVGKGWLRPTIDLEDLAAHGVLEHNGSLTRADAYEESHEPSRSRSRSPSSASSTAFSTATSPPHFSHPSLLASLPLYSVLSGIVFSVLSRLPFFSLVTRFPPFSLLISKPEHVRSPCHSSPSLIRALLADSASGTHLTLNDVARARVRRSASTRPNSRILSQFADGEFAMTLDFLGDGQVELEVLREWLEEERLPRGWKPSHVQGLWRTHMTTEKVRALMAGIRKYQQKTREVKTVVYE